MFNLIIPPPLLRFNFFPTNKFAQGGANFFVVYRPKRCIFEAFSPFFNVIFLLFSFPFFIFLPNFNFFSPAGLNNLNIHGSDREKKREMYPTDIKMQKPRIKKNCKIYPHKTLGIYKILDFFLTFIHFVEKF